MPRGQLGVFPRPATDTHAHSQIPTLTATMCPAKASVEIDHTTWCELFERGGTADVAQTMYTKS